MANIMNVKFIAAQFLLAAVLVVQGCATTDELYAEYDCNECKKVPLLNNASVVSTVVASAPPPPAFVWEPAIYFHWDRSALVQREMHRLDYDLKILSMFPDATLVVRGFADATGSREYNRALADRRVTSVVTYLAENGFPVERVRRAPLGESLPLTEDVSLDNLASNRRVELLLVDETGRPYNWTVQGLAVAQDTGKRGLEGRDVFDFLEIVEERGGKAPPADSADSGDKRNFRGLSEVAEPIRPTIDDPQE
jgi:outer membrane protein OmpA-like peptidoglycan-associated protein